MLFFSVGGLVRDCESPGQANAQVRQFVCLGYPNAVVYDVTAEEEPFIKVKEGHACIDAFTDSRFRLNDDVQS